MTLWLIHATWAIEGRVGETESVVAAPNAIEALRLFWGCEQDEQLRNVTIKWLTSEDCIIREYVEEK